MAAKLNGTEKLIWNLHCSGLAPSQIAFQTKYDEPYVRNTITRVWAEGGSVAKDG